MIEIAEKVIREAKVLPTVPSVVSELAVLLKDDTAGASDFEKVVRNDPSLTANLLRLANSAYFGIRREVSSVRQAIAYLGTERLFELAASAWLSQTLPERISGYDISAKSLWLHCVATGVLCEQLASALHLRSPDMAFTAGLLHDIGKLIIGTLLIDETGKNFKDIQDSERTFAEMELRILGTDHAEIGGVLCASWNLPKPLEWAARWHHDPDACPLDADQQLVDLIHVADGLSHTLGFGADAGEHKTHISVETTERLLIDENIVDVATSDSVINQIWEIGHLVAGGISC